MGYHTDFEGRFNLDRPLDFATHRLLTGLATTRRLARNVGPEYGVEGEFYIDGTGMLGQGMDPTIIDHNTPPRTQPGLWCQWTPTEDNQGLEWDGGEKFYDCVEWLQYLLDKVLIPNGYVLNGVVKWDGEEQGDVGEIHVADNVVTTRTGRLVFEEASR